MENSIHRPVFGNQDGVDQLVLLLRAARAKQSVHLAVAPMVSLDVVRLGKVTTLHPGDEVLLTDWVAEHTVQACLRSLTDNDVVIEFSAEELMALATPKNARYVVGPGGSVSSKRGIAPSGTEVTSDDFLRGQLDLDSLVARGVVIDRKPEPLGPGK